MDELIPWFRTQLEAAKADAEYNAGMSVDAGWNPDRVKEHVEAHLRVLDLYEELYEPHLYEAIQHLAVPFSHQPGYQESWRP